jgi:ParB family chromosome partitioning protein
MTHLATLHLPLSAIAVGERIGFFSAAHATRLGESMAADGQHAPIQVRRNGNAAKLPWTLVAGLHRLRGAEHQGWTEIAAIQVADKTATPADLRRMELAENLNHLMRRPIERAIMMAEYARLEEEIDHPGHVGECSQARALRVRQGTDVIVTDVATWRERTAAAFDCSLSKLEKHLRLYRAIAVDLSDLAEQVNAHPLGESLSYMTSLAQHRTIESRRLVAETLLSGDDWPNMQAVEVAAGITNSTGKRGFGDGHYGLKLRAAWQELTPIAKQSHFVEMAEGILPSLVRETIELLKERLP